MLQYQPDKVKKTVLSAFPPDSQQRINLENFFDGGSNDVTLLWTNDVDPKNRFGLKLEDHQVLEIVNHCLDLEKPNRHKMSNLNGWGNGLTEEVVRTTIPEVWMLRVDGYGGHQLRAVIYKLLTTDSLKANQTQWTNLVW